MFVLKEPKTTGLIFASGKIVITGARCEKDARAGALKFARIIQKLDFSPNFNDFKIQNVVATCDFKFPIYLERLAYDHSRFTTYEPELFPGLIFRMADPKLTILVFVSGKIVMTGAKDRRLVYDALEKIYPVLLQYKKGVIRRE